MTAATSWSAGELERRVLLEQGVAVAVNLRNHHNLIGWANERGLFVRVDRATPWGNPFASRRAARQGARVLVHAAGVPCGRARHMGTRRFCDELGGPTAGVGPPVEAAYSRVARCSVVADTEPGSVWT